VSKTLVLFAVLVVVALVTGVLAIRSYLQERK
jgi:hypothetical protein